MPDYNPEEWHPQARELKNPLSCRNCRQVYSIEDMKRVKPGYKYCMQCFDKMMEIGQVVKDWRTKDGTMIQLWQGDPFRSGVVHDRIMPPGSGW